MKKLLIGLFCAALLLSMTACGEEEKASTDVTAPSNNEPSVSDSTTPSGEDSTTSATESGDTTGDTPDGTTGTQDGTTNCVVSDPTKSTGTTKKPTTAKKPTGTQAQVSDNVANWEDTFGKDEPTGTTGKQEGTTTTKKPTTTTTTKPTTTTTLKPTTIDQVSLPAVGSDIDARKPGRIGISAISLKSGVMSITIRNNTDKNGPKFITEETDYVTYACYDKNGKQLKGSDETFGYLYLGCLEVGKEISFNVTLPAGTARVEITGCKIVYWTPWTK